MARILIVDDDVNTTNVLQLMLEQFGHDSVIASDGQKGLELAIEERPEIIITDVLMPGDGWLYVV